MNSPDLRSLSSPNRDPSLLEYANGPIESLEQILDRVDRQIENAVY